MKKKYFTYILLIVFSLFMFDNKVEAEILSGDNVGYEKTCKELNLKKNWLFDTGNYDFNCIYSKDVYIKKNVIASDVKGCIIVQISFNVDGVIDGKPLIFNSNVSTWRRKPGGIGGYEVAPVEFIKSYTQCPNEIYVVKSNDRKEHSLPLQLYTFNQNGKDEDVMKLINSKVAPDVKDKMVENIKIIKGEPKFEKLKCEEILGDDLIEMLQKFVDIIKVFVPILVIVFGILDFSRAIFSFDEGEMKKAQTKFIKRIIIAMAFFLIPTLLGVVLDIAHNIWPSIDNSLCNIEF